MVTMQNYLPTYFKEVLLLDLKNVSMSLKQGHLFLYFQNGFFSALPFFTQLILKNVLAILCDFLKRRGMIKPTSACKIFQSICESV
jgi:hypothetical protein